MKARLLIKLVLGIIFLFSTAACKTLNGVPKDSIPPHQSFSLFSKILNEQRLINVWKPPYYEEGSDNFPVLYMPDGGLREDFPHIANTLAELIKADKIPPFILIGIENTERGRDLTGFSEVEEHAEYNIPMEDGAQDFRRFIEEELFPYIQGKYRCNGEKGIIGESLAGLFVMETFFLNPSMFNYYIAMDPSLWWNNNSLGQNAETHLKQLPKRKTKLWFAGSRATDINIYTEQMALFLETQSLPNLEWKYSPEPQEQHHTIYRATKEKALIWTLNP